MRAIVAVLLCLVPSLAVAEPARRLTLQQAIDEAMRTSPSVSAARARSDARRDAARALRGQLLPRVGLADEQTRYRDPWNPTLLGETFHARDVDTNVFTVSVEQPLLGLLSLTAEKSALDHTAEAALKTARAAELDLREAVRLGFLALFEARAIVSAAHTSVEQLLEQTRVTQSRLSAGVALSGELLRVKVALATARQQEIQAHANEQVARARLMEIVGRGPEDTSIDFEEPTEIEHEIEAPGPLEHLLDQAFERRLDLQSARLRSEAERSRARGRRLDLLPGLSVVGAYQHIRGEVLAPADASWLGIRVSWTAWDWGAKYYEGSGARHDADAVQVEEELLRRKIATEVAECAAELDAASSAVTLATEAIVSAEEAYRVTDVQVRAGTATVTDLLDAQSALTQVRLNLVRARYARAMASVLLAHATGA